MGFFSFRVRLAIEGIMPERALLRLKRAGIDVFDVKKSQKNQIVLSVNKKDTEKVFAIYPKVCYNNNVQSAYVARPLGKVGAFKYASRFKNRVGFLLGALLFCASALYADSFVFGVEFIGGAGYEREALAILAEHKIKPFSRYQSGEEDLICAKLLALKDVEFCSVKKSGFRVVVEIRCSSFPVKTLQKGALKARQSGEIMAITALRGALLKQKGDKIEAGETLVGDYFETVSGERKKIEVIARARIACVYETELTASDEQVAFATCYLHLNLSQNDEIKSVEITKSKTVEDLFHVKISYEIFQTLNM